MTNSCECCICKTCAIAYTNGGVEQCGNCEVCKKTNYELCQTICDDYYNPEEDIEKVLEKIFKQSQE